MADREVRYLFRNKKTSGSTLPNNYMVGEPFVNVYEGRMFFYGVEGGSYTPANGQINVFEVGGNVGTLNAGVILSAGTNLYDIFLTEVPPGDFTRIQDGLNTYTGGTGNFPTVNVSAATLDNLSVSGASSLGVVSATTIISGSTNLYDIFLTTHDGNDITRVQNGLNTYTGGTDNYPTVNVSAATLDNLSVSGASSLGVVSATTIVSGSTNLYDIFLTTHDGNDITRIQHGLNTYTGGTDNYPTVNVSAATLDNLSVSGASSLGVVSATTIVSGSTNLYDIFKMYSENIILLSGSSWNSTAHTQTVAITSTTISDEAIIWVSPKNTRTDTENYANAEIFANNNSFSSITFECVSIPTVNINVSVIIKNQ